jgi:adenylate cyclase
LFRCRTYHATSHEAAAFETVMGLAARLRRRGDECPDPSVRAVQMAVEMRDAVSTLAVKWRKLGHELGFGMGIARGYATLGRIGFEGRYDYSAIGTVVNLAARLCAEARSGQILVDGKVRMAVEALTDTEPLGELALKGMQRPVPAWCGCRGAARRRPQD